LTADVREFLCATAKHLCFLDLIFISGMIKEKTLRIGFIGCGKMAQALAKGFIASGKETLLPDN
jgi:hypothetical protein